MYLIGIEYPKYKMNIYNSITKRQPTLKINKELSGNFPKEDVQVPTGYQKMISPQRNKNQNPQ